MLFFFAALLVSVRSITMINGTWSFCTGKDAQQCPNPNKYANVTGCTFNGGNPIPVGQNYTTEGTGWIFEDIQDPSYSMQVIDGIVVNDDVKGDACKGNSQKFPFSDGVLYYMPLKCPITKGQELKVDIVTDIAAKCPNGQVQTTFKLFDQPKQKGNCIACLVIINTLS
eukprot:159719_1